MEQAVEQPLHLTFNTTVESSDAQRRIIAGKIVPFGEIGNTSAGQVVFEKGSISYNTNGKIKLLLEHNAKDPIGMMQNASEDASGIYASFKVAPTTKGNDALIEAAELRDGLSVGVIVDAAEPRNGILYVTKASLREVSLVQAAAFSTASVSAISATEATPEPVEETTQPTESEASVDNATPAPEVEAAQTVEASQPKYTPIAHTSPRSPILTGGNYLEHSIRAKLGNEDSRQWVLAADDSFTTNPAFSPVSYVRDVAQNTNADRPVIEACGGTRPLNSYGMTVSIPKITANSTAATVAEGGDPTGTTAITSAYINATVIKKMGWQRYSVELLDRSDPSFYEIMLKNLRDAYAQATDAYVIAQITAGGTQATATAADSAGIISFVSTESPAAYTATKRTATAFTSGTSIWSLLMGATDTTGRPIYNAGNPMNNAGSAIPTSVRGNVLGLDYYVDPNMVSTSIDESAFIIEPNSIEIFESPALTLATNVPTTGEIELALYGYIAAGVTFAGGLRRFNLT